MICGEAYDAWQANRPKWLRHPDCIYEAVMSKRWNQKRRAFSLFYESEELDASPLITSLFFFKVPNDLRIHQNARGRNRVIVKSGDMDQEY